MTLRDELLAYAETVKGDVRPDLFAWWVADLKAASDRKLEGWRDRLRKFGRFL